MAQHFDALERQPHKDRIDRFFDRFPRFLAEAKADCAGLAQHLKGVDAGAITDYAALSHLPILRKSDLMVHQQELPPFGGFVPDWALKGGRVFMSPGPIWEPQAIGADPWHAARALHAAGFKSGDIVLNTLSYHGTPGGFILDEGLRALGCCVFPAGPGQSEMQARSAATLGAKGYAGTPDFLKTILDKADELGLDLSKLTKALVSGGALFPSMREDYAKRNVRVQQAYATADLGVIAYETMADGALCEGMVVSEDMLVEIVRPGSNVPVKDGEVGEVVVSTLNGAYPLVRFATGDLSAVLSDPSPCGRTNTRLKGWMGRADQRTKVKGMFIDPVQIERIVESADSIEKARAIVGRKDGQDTLQLLVVAQDGSHPDLERIADLFRSETGLGADVKEVDAAAIANDGLIIEDSRDYET